MIKQAKFPYFPFGKPFEKQTKTIEKQGKNKEMLSQIKTIYIYIHKERHKFNFRTKKIG